MTQATAVAFLWGDDTWGLEAATEAFRTRADLFPFGAPERWRLRGDDGTPARVLGALQERLATGAMFGSGTLAILAGVGPLVRRGEDRNALIATLGLIAPGNGLVIVEETASGRKDAPHKPLVDAVRAVGGSETQLRAPRTGELTRWIETRARELGVNLGPGAAQELATRIGGFVAEGDIDRRRQGQLAFMELGKLALFRIDGTPVSVADVQELVPEAVPGSIWGFVDAIGLRNVQRAMGLSDRILESTPGPVLVAVLHRRIRELLEIADRLRSGERAQNLPRSMKLNPYRAETLAGQAARWTPEELASALQGILDLDAMGKGVPGYSPGEAQHRLAFVRWITERVAKPT